MEVLTSRVLFSPTDPVRSREFYRDQLGLAIYREFGTGPERGTVFLLGGGLLELSGRAEQPPEDHLESVLRLFRREVWHGRLLADDELDLRNEARNELSIRSDGASDGIAPLLPNTLSTSHCGPIRGPD